MSVLPSDSPHFFSPSGGPDFTFETRLHDQGIAKVCGVDEAGRGPLAGPVTAAAVMLDPQYIPDGLNDSKKLSETKRELLFEEILTTSQVAIAHMSAATIDAINIREASLLAMRHAIEALEFPADHALIDGNAQPVGLGCKATTIIKGDARSLSIAAASIMAKVLRDRLMIRADVDFPEYGFARHKGYPTKDHRAAVTRFGPSPLHRLSFAPVAAALHK